MGSNFASQLRATLDRVLAERVEVEDRLRHGDFWEHKDVTSLLSHLPAEEVLTEFRALNALFRWLDPQEQEFICARSQIWSDRALDTLFYDVSRHRPGSFSRCPA